MFFRSIHLPWGVENRRRYFGMGCETLSWVFPHATIEGNRIWLGGWVKKELKTKSKLETMNVVRLIIA